MEFIWKRKFEELVQFMQDAEFDIKNKGFDQIKSRAWNAPHTVYVSFAFDVCDTEAHAIKHFGEGKYDTYKLIKKGDD